MTPAHHTTPRRALAAAVVAALGLACAHPAPAVAPRTVVTAAGLPIVFMHGMAGFDSLAGVEYFRGVAEALRARGHVVAVTVVDPFAPVEHRARQAAPQIDRVLVESGAPRVYLVGHSQGGLDARYLVSVLGYADRAATVTTIGTPHHCTLLADAFSDSAAGRAATDIAGALASVLVDSRVELAPQLVGLSRRYMEEVFNPATGDVPGVRYYSYGGVTQPWLLVDLRTTDIVNPLFWASYLWLWRLEGANDGLVPVASARWGEYLGTLPADHLDQIGHPAGMQICFDHLAFYVGLADFLQGRAPPPRYPD